MTSRSSSGGRSVDEVRQYLCANVNSALCHPGMWGGEIALTLLFDALAFADRIEETWRQEIERLSERRLWTSTRVSGGLARLLPDCDCAVASVYAEFAHRVRWLVTQRELPHREHDELIAAAATFASHDSTMTDVVSTFGPPSVLLGGTNPRYPKTLVYTSSPEMPIVCFHLWNALTGQGAAAIFDEPILLATRIGGRLIPFTFTPEGRRRRREQQELPVAD